MDLVLVGHAHNYERIAPIDPSGKIDRNRGVRQFVVGTGGRSAASASKTPLSFSEAHAGKTFGALRLILKSSGYEWRFQTIPGSPVALDTGSGQCH